MAAQAGKDLVAEERHTTKEAAARVTVTELIDIYVRRRVRGRLRTADKIEARLRRALSDYSAAAAEAEDVCRRDIRELLDRVAERGALREAEKQRQLIGTMFRWAVGQDFIGSDPTSGLAGYSTGERRERVLSDDEIRALWHWVEVLPQDYSAALRLQLSLGARIGEVAGLRAEEIDQNWIWTLPASRSKNRRPRLTPLVGLARQIVSERLAVFERGSLFFGEMGAPLSSQHVASMLVKRRRKPMPVSHFTSHDLRRTVATRLVEIGVPYETVAAVLGHEVGGTNVRILMRHYVRTELLEQKYTALCAWDASLREILLGGNTQPEFVTNVPSSVPQLMYLP